MRQIHCAIEHLHRGDYECAITLAGAAEKYIAGHPEIGFVHRKRYQEIPGHERMGIRPVSL